MKKRVLSLLLAVVMALSLLPMSVLAAESEPKYVVSSNVEWATDKSDTEKPYLRNKKNYITADGLAIQYSATQAIWIENYTAIAEKCPLNYIEIEGLKIYYSDFVNQGDNFGTVDTSSCPNLNGREVQIRLYKGGPQAKFVQKTGEEITSDIEINVVFYTGPIVAAHDLTAEAGENGTLLAYKFLHDLDDGNSVYGIWVRPDNEYQLTSYTMDGMETPLALKNKNYVTWTFDEADANGTSTMVCNYIEVTVAKDSQLTLNFAPAEIALSLVGYKPVNVEETKYSLFWSYSDLDKAMTNSGVKTVALIEGFGAKLWFTVEVKGFVADRNPELTDAPDPDNPPRTMLESFKVYSGTEKTDDTLLFSMGKATGGFGDSRYSYVNDQWPDRRVYSGTSSGLGYIELLSCPMMEQITVEMAGYNGQDYSITITESVQMSTDMPAVKEFADYYTSTYGLDKMGQAAYTDAEKQTEGYKLYCQYSTFRYVLRKVYNEQLQNIAFADDPTETLKEAKAALDGAARGENCNAMSWSVLENPDSGTSSKPILVAVPKKVSSSFALEAALEAEYPGNWTYTITNGFVNFITAGGENDIGSTTSATGSDAIHNYAFFFHNGEFSNLGVGSYSPFDGDVLAWGNPDVVQSWNYAILRYHYKNIGGDEALNAAMKEKGVTTTSTTEELEAAFPDINFSRYGQFREVTQGEKVMQLIAGLDQVSPDSGETIRAAREAYDALSDEEKQEVNNYQTLLDAEEAFAKLTQSVDISYNEAMNNTLIKLSKSSLWGGYEWRILAMARGGLISGTDTSGKGPQALNFVTGLMGSYRADDGKPTDFARTSLAMTSLGAEVPQDILDLLCAYDKVTAQGINAVAYSLIALDSKPYITDNTDIRDKYIQYMLDNVLNGGGWAYGDDKTADADVDMTAMVIQALAPYYKTDAKVKAAVDKGLEILKSMQKSTGGFSSYGTYNAESNAQVIVALTALGIDPKSEEWTRENGDPIEALLHFYNSKTAQFCHTINGKDDDMATDQAAYALVAYSRFVNEQNTLYDMSDAFGGSGEALDPQQTVATAKMEVNYKFWRIKVPSTLISSKEEGTSYMQDCLKMLTTKGPTYEFVPGTFEEDFVPAVDGTEEAPEGTTGDFFGSVRITMGDIVDTASVYIIITPTPYEPPKPDVTVTFQLLGDTHHEVDGEDTIHTYRNNKDELPVWIDTVTVTMPGGSTVGDVFKQVMDENGYTYKGLENGYIESITQPNGGISLKAMDDDRSDSGWMYLVNGEYPSVGLNGYELSDGDTIVWHWTDSWKVENGMSAGKKLPYEVVGMIDAIGDVDLTKGTAISAARSAYDALTDEEKTQVTNYDKLEKAEAEYAKLVAEMGKKLDEIYKTTGDFMSRLGTPTVNSTGGEWMVIGLARSGRTVPAGYYDNVVEYVKAMADANERLHPAKVTDNARVILGLTSIGKDVTNVGGHNLLKGLDNMAYVQKQGINGPIFTLIALDSHNYPTMGDVTREKLIQVILDAQLNDGGWDLSADKADPDMTAMAIQALAPYYKTNETVKAAVDKALEALSTLQRSDGGFGSWGTVNSESCAQVIVALTALGIDPTADSRFVKNGLTVLDALAGFYVTGGGFKHTADGERNGMATEQSYYALAAYFRFANAQTSLYDMSDVTIQIDSHTHAFGAWTVTTPATCTTDGVETRSCACGETETRIIPATGHVDADHDGKCDVCQAVITPVEPGKTDPSDPGKTDPTNPGTDTPATGDTGVLVWVIALPVALLAAALVLKRKEREE